MTGSAVSYPQAPVEGMDDADWFPPSALTVPEMIGVAAYAASRKP